MTEPLFRIEPEGPGGSGLTAWDPIDPAKIESGTPVQHGHLYDEDADLGYTAGVWHCTEFVDLAGPYPVDEFMLVLEGTVVMAMPDGSAVTIRAGDAFVIPKGLDCQWRMPEAVRKIFMILDRPEVEGAANPSLSRVTHVRPLDPSAAPAAEEGVAAERLWFLNADGRMSVSVTDHAGGRMPAAADPAHRLVTVVRGRARVASGAGTQDFGAGDSFYLRAGTPAAWEIDPGTRLLEARFLPVPPA